MSTLLEQLARAIKQVQDRHHRTLDSRLRPLGITLVQWNALREIRRHEGASVHQLAEVTFNSDQAFGTLSVRLTRRGLVQRSAGPGKAVLHHLTADGQRLLHQGRDIVLEVFSASFASLDDRERNTLLHLLAKTLGTDR